MSRTTTETNGNDKEEIENIPSQQHNHLQTQSGVSQEVFIFLKDLLESSGVEEQKINGDLISVDTQLHLALNFLTTGTNDKISDKIPIISQETLKSYVMNLINCLIRIAPQFIKFPTEEESFKEKFYALGKDEEGTGFPHVLGIISNMHVQLEEPNNQPELYLNSNNQCTIRVQIVCGPDLQIYNVLAAFPNGCRNLFIWSNSNLRRILAESNNANTNQCWLLGGSDYPQEPWLMTPIINPKSPSEELYNKIHSITSKSIRECIKLLKLRFHCLQSKLDYDPSEVYAIATACCALHNICVHYNDFPIIEGNLLEMEINSEIASEADTEAGVFVRKELIKNYFTC